MSAPATPLKSWRVVVARAVERDLDEIYDYIEAQSGAARAEKVFARLRAQIHGLAEFPERGSWPPELLDLGVRDFRQLVVRPWRIFYKVSEGQVNVLLIADSRRDLRTLFERRLFGADGPAI